MTYKARCSWVQTVKDCCHDYQNLTSLTIHEKVAENGAFINNHLSSLFFKDIGGHVNYIIHWLICVISISKVCLAVIE